MAAEIHLLLWRVWREPAQTKSLSLSHEISRLSQVVLGSNGLQASSSNKAELSTLGGSTASEALVS
jgi:hypothetical protein